MRPPRFSDPRSVGTDPDCRFTPAVGAINLIENIYGRERIGLTLLVLSFLTAATSYRRWARNERSMRLMLAALELSSIR